jgi:regulator of RNase E activity RraB
MESFISKFKIETSAGVVDWQRNLTMCILQRLFKQANFYNDHYYMTEIIHLKIDNDLICHINNTMNQSCIIDMKEILQEFFGQEFFEADKFILNFNLIFGNIEIGNKEYKIIDQLLFDISYEVIEGQNSLIKKENCLIAYDVVKRNSLGVNPINKNIDQIVESIRKRYLILDPFSTFTQRMSTYLQDAFRCCKCPIVKCCICPIKNFNYLIDNFNGEDVSQYFDIKYVLPKHNTSKYPNCVKVPEKN